MTDETIDVVLPVLDEAGALRWVLPRLPEGYRAIVVDNGSTDGSADVARELGATVVTEERRGFGAACFRGLAASTSTVVCFMDCDGSLDPADLPTISDPVSRGQEDLVLGSRQPERGSMQLHVRAANRYLAWRVVRRTGARLTDIGPMRAGRRDGLLALGIIDRRSGWPLEMVLRAGAERWRIAERPVPYYPRAGHSKVTGTVGGTIQAIIDMSAVLAEAGKPAPEDGR